MSGDVRRDHLSGAISRVRHNDKRAILLLMGRSLNGSARPSPTLGDYLEGYNATALSSPQYVFEHRAGVATSINDRAVVVCPDTALCP